MALHFLRHKLPEVEDQMKTYIRTAQQKAHLLDLPNHGREMIHNIRRRSLSQTLL